jgi:hypothetical protein
VGTPEHAVEVQLPVVDHDPELQVAERVPVYPELHIGTHVDPEAAPETQFPAPAFMIVGVPEQVVGAVGANEDPTIGGFVNAQRVPGLVVEFQPGTEVV